MNIHYLMFKFFSCFFYKTSEKKEDFSYFLYLLPLATIYLVCSCTNSNYRIFCKSRFQVQQKLQEKNCVLFTDVHLYPKKRKS